MKRAVQEGKCQVPVSFTSQQSVSPALQELQIKLEYSFKNPGLLKQALTRVSAISSGIHGEKASNYRTLAFLGDKVLGMVVGDILIEQHPEYEVGQLTEETQNLVKNKDSPLSGIAKKLGLGSCLIMGPGEERNDQGRKNQKTLASAMEAVIGAIFLDSGRSYEVVKDFIGNHWYGLNKSDVLFILAARIRKSSEEYIGQPEVAGQIIEAIKRGADVRHRNKYGLTIFHLIGGEGPIEEILEAQKNLEGINLEGIPKDTFEGYEEATDDIYYRSLNLRGTDFRRANLRGLNLSSRTISNVDFTGADLTEVDFSFVKFYNTKFTLANLLRAKLDYCTMDIETRKSYLEAVKGNSALPVRIKLNEAEFWQAIEKNEVEQVAFFIKEEGMKVNIVNRLKLTPLHIAAGNGFTEMTRLLLENRAEANARVIRVHPSADGCMFLSANWEYHLQSTTCIGSCPIIMGIGAKGGQIAATPLHLAASNGHKAIVRLLLQHRAKVDDESHEFTPYALALKQGHKEVAAMLKTQQSSSSLSSMESNIGDRAAIATAATLWHYGREAEADAAFLGLTGRDDHKARAEPKVRVRADVEARGPLPRALVPEHGDRGAAPALQASRGSFSYGSLASDQDQPSSRLGGSNPTIVRRNRKGKQGASTFLSLGDENSNIITEREGEPRAALPSLPSLGQSVVATWQQKQQREDVDRRCPDHTVIHSFVDQSQNSRENRKNLINPRAQVAARISSCDKVTERCVVL